MSLDMQTYSQDEKRLKSAIKRMNEARRFPDNTCPASRHVAAMAEALADGMPCPMLIEEPGHCAESLAAVVAALWELRGDSQGPSIVLKAVDDEPELPGDMPDEMWDAIAGDRDAMAEALRIAVRQTKDGIRKRIGAL